MTKPPLKARNVKSAAKKERRGFSRQGRGSREPVHDERTRREKRRRRRAKSAPEYRRSACPCTLRGPAGVGYLAFPAVWAPGWVQSWLVRVTPLVSLSKRV